MRVNVMKRPMYSSENSSAEKKRAMISEFVPYASIRVQRENIMIHESLPVSWRDLRPNSRYSHFSFDVMTEAMAGYMINAKFGGYV